MVRQHREKGKYAKIVWWVRTQKKTSTLRENIYELGPLTAFCLWTVLIWGEFLKFPRFSTLVDFRFAGNGDLRWEEGEKLTATTSHLKLGASFADLVNVWQRASVVWRPRLGQAELLDLLKLHLPLKDKPACASGFKMHLWSLIQKHTSNQNTLRSNENLSDFSGAG